MFGICVTLGCAPPPCDTFHDPENPGDKRASRCDPRKDQEFISPVRLNSYWVSVFVDRTASLDSNRRHNSAGKQDSKEGKEGQHAQDESRTATISADTQNASQCRDSDQTDSDTVCYKGCLPSNAHSSEALIKLLGPAEVAQLTADARIVHLLLQELVRIEEEHGGVIAASFSVPADSALRDSQVGNRRRCVVAIAKVKQVSAVPVTQAEFLGNVGEFFVELALNVVLDVIPES